MEFTSLNVANMLNPIVLRMAKTGVLAILSTVGLMLMNAQVSFAIPTAYTVRAGRPTSAWKI